jgi:hypothetical protein
MAPQRTSAHMALFSLYALAAGALGVLAVEPELLPDTAPASHDTGMRALLVAAGVLSLSLFVGALRRVRWVRALALFLHGLVALIALAGLVALALGSPLFEGELAELAAKFGVHAALTALWASAWMKRALVRESA